MPFERNERLLATLRRFNATQASFTADGALLSVTLGPDSALEAETQNDTPKPVTRSATPGLVPRVVRDSK